MAGFKKVPDSNSDAEYSEFVQAAVATVGEIALSYWPLLGGGLCLFVLIVMGRERTAIPVGIAVVILQAWLSFG